MAMYHADMTPAWEDAMSYGNLAFTLVFTGEMALKMVAYHPRLYFRDGWNQFDCFVVGISWVGTGVDFGTTQNLPFLPLLRILRIVRVFKLVPQARARRRASAAARDTVRVCAHMPFFCFWVLSALWPTAPAALAQPWQGSADGGSLLSPQRCSTLTHMRAPSLSARPSAAAPPPLPAAARDRENRPRACRRCSPRCGSRCR